MDFIVYVKAVETKKRNKEWVNLPDIEKKHFYCEKCHKTLAEKEFYGSNNLEKYPEGKLA